MSGVKKKALVIGGTSGLGHHIANKLQTNGHSVLVAGRNRNEKAPWKFSYLDMASRDMGRDFDSIASRYGVPDVLVYASGFYQQGTIDVLHDEKINAMIDVTLRGPSILFAHALRTWGKLPPMVVITSTSEIIPRLEEPVYAAAKRGLGGLVESLSFDERVGKILVAAPARMNTNFWKYTPTFGKEALSSEWVADRIFDLFKDEYKFRHAKILRDPARVEITQTRLV